MQFKDQIGNTIKLSKRPKRIVSLVPSQTELLIDLGLKDEAFPLFEGSDTHLRSFTYVGDIVDGVVSVIGNETKVDGEIINLGTEVEHTTQEGIEAVEQVLGKKIKINVIAKRAGDQLRTKANIDKARKLLNYNPQTTLLDAVKYQVAWFKENFC